MTHAYHFGAALSEKAGINDLVTIRHYHRSHGNRSVQSMNRCGKEHGRRLERLIKFVNREQEAGRLTEQQVKEIALASLKPLEEQENSLAYFMMGGGISEEVARKCCDLLVEQLKQHFPNDDYLLKLLKAQVRSEHSQRRR